MTEASTAEPEEQGAERKPAGQSWRDRIKVHPAADLFPMMPNEELSLLAADINAHRMQSPIVFWGGAKTRASGDVREMRKVHEAKVGCKIPLLDGRNRLAAMEAVGILDDRVMLTVLENAKIHYGDPHTYVISANIHRRHLTGEGLAKVIRGIKAARPELSIRSVAEMTGAPKSTVARALDEGIPGPPVPNGTPEPQPARVTGRDGKTYPAAKRRPVAEATKPTKPKQIASPRDEAVVAFCKVLHSDPIRTFDDFIKIVDGDRAAILAKTRQAHRIQWATAFAKALGVSRQTVLDIHASLSATAQNGAEPPGVTLAASGGAA